ncbi:MAG: recombinase family protein [Bacillota bacterium]
MKKAVAYIRVSGKSDGGSHSFEFQKCYWQEHLERSEEVELCGIYADKGISGRTQEKRLQFVKMIEDCKAGGIDVIYTKSVQRFGRNTAELLQTVRELRDMNVEVIFDKEHISTFQTSSEIYLIIAASIAENDVSTNSLNQKWAYEEKFSKGHVVVGKGVLGYKMTEDNTLEIVEEEGDIVKRIFREYLCGYSVNQIVDGLKRDDIPTKRNGTNWQRSTIMRMLENIKYKGDAILGKTYKPDVLSPKRIKNDGKMPMYYVENSHPAIIEKEFFDLVQEEIKIRKKADYATKTGEGKYVSKYPFSGMIICGDCMSRYRRLIRKNPNGKEIPTWVCTHRIANHDGKCESITLKESDVEKAYLSALKELAENMLNANQITNTIEAAINADKTAEIDTIEEEIITLQQQAIALHTARKNSEITDDVYQNQIEILSKELRAKESAQAKIKTLNAEKILTESRKAKILEISKQATLLQSFDTALMKSLLQRIIVINKTTLKLEFKGGESVVRGI